MGLRGGINKYVYASNSPVNYIDPFGKNAGVLVLVGGGSNPVGWIIVGTAAVIAVGYLAYQEYQYNHGNTCSIQYQSDRTSAKGEPNSSDVFEDGDNVTERLYGEEGYADVDIDYGHNHGAGDPHYHEWDWTKQNPRGPGQELPK